MQDKVTIVIPTHERHHLLETRALPHYLTLGLPILVIDSSREPHGPSRDNPAIDYVHCPGEPLPHKMKRPVIDRVKTPYMLMSADDTVTSMQGIRDCVSFLDENDDFSSASGVFLQCYHDDKDRIFSISHEDFIIQPDSPRPEERLLQHFVRFFPCFMRYSVRIPGRIFLNGCHRR